MRRRLNRTPRRRSTDAGLGADGFWTLSGGADALRHNRRGVLARQQRTALLRGGIALTVLFLAIGGWWLYLAVGGSLSDSGDRWILGIGGGFLVAAVPLILYYRVAAVRAGAVDRVVGTVTVYSIKGRLQVKLHGRRYSAPSRCPVVTGGKYRLYVAPKAAAIVAVEPAGRPADLRTNRDATATATAADDAGGDRPAATTGPD
jgi:hypothetical protein